MLVVSDIEAPPRATTTWAKGIDGPTYEIAATIRSPLRVAAGPGTGKTFALMRRLARLLEEGSDPSKILLISFTRTGARDIAYQVQQQGLEAAHQVKASTLHGHCYRLLANPVLRQYVGRSPRLLFEFEEWFLRQDLKDLPTRSMRACELQLTAFNAAWARLQHEVPGWPLDPVDRRFHLDLIGWLEFHDAMLVGELPTRVLDYLKANPAAPEMQFYDHVLVDEYQDLNKADQELVNLLASAGSLVVIGDEDQSIYGSLRHAEPEGMREFAETHPDTLNVPLNECRRCPAVVVNMANQLIQMNRGREPRTLRALRRDQGLVNIVQWQDQEAEAQGIAQYISWYIAKNPGTRLSDILVMSPRRIHGMQIWAELVARGVPAVSYFFEEPMDNDQAKERYTLLCLLDDPNDRVSLRCWLGLGHPEGRRGEYSRLREFAFASGLNPRTVLEQLDQDLISIPHTKGLLGRWRFLQNRVAELRDLTGLELIDALFPEDIESVAELRNVGLGELNADDKERVTATRLRGAIVDRLVNPEPPSTDSCVRIMSPYKAKGLTVKVAIVAGAVQGWLPSVDHGLQGAARERQLEEQRRLFYVAITRPTEVLVISSFLQMPVSLAHHTQVEFTRDRSDSSLANVVSSQFVREFGATAPEAQLGRDWITSIESVS